MTIQLNTINIIDSARKKIILWHYSLKHKYLLEEQL